MAYHYLWLEVQNDKHHRKLAGERRGALDCGADYSGNSSSGLRLGAGRLYRNRTGQFLCGAGAALSGTSVHDPDARSFSAGSEWLSAQTRVAVYSGLCGPRFLFRRDRLAGPDHPQFHPAQHRSLRIDVLSPSNPAELSEALPDAADGGRTIALTGHATKRLMAGPVEPAEVEISTLSMRRVIEYEPRDLTISVDAGLSWRDLSCLLAENRQMVPLDPPYGDTATVGGVIAANTSGPRRRLYGSARDLVIGMQFATLQGKLAHSGGMVVKNVAGLDMAKLMIGSFGTLAAIAVVNFKLMPVPEVERTALLSFDTLAGAIEARDRTIRSVLQPEAVDLLNPLVAAQIGQRGYVLA